MSLRTLSPRTLLAIGWAGFLLYAYPGYMSFDSMRQLIEARDGVYAGGHPPMMGLLWAMVDVVVAGPVGMLVIQSVCFLVGTYLLLARYLRPRPGAIAASLVLWFPPISSVLAVIWKDSQMAGFLVLGTALLLSERRWLRVVALAVLFLATGMRYNALAMTLPLIVLLFTWSPGHRWFVRYPLALVVWVVVTMSASSFNAALSKADVNMWARSLALLDLTGTVRYAPALSDDELRRMLAGAPLNISDGIQAAAQQSHPASDLDEFTVSTLGTGTYVPALWVTALHVFRVPQTPGEVSAIERGWRAMVLGHPAAFLEYRWNVTRERIHFGDDEIPSATYVWFVDVTHIGESAQALGHNAVPGKLQAKLRDAMLSVSTSFVFRPWPYIALSLLLVVLALRRRDVLALVLSGLASEALLFLIAPTIDYRYSIWIVVSTLLAIVMLVGRRLASASSRGQG